MPGEKTVLAAQKAAVFDLIQIFKSEPDKTCTPEEIKALIVAYIKGAEQQGRIMCAHDGNPPVYGTCKPFSSPYRRD